MNPIYASKPVSSRAFFPDLPQKSYSSLFVPPFLLVITYKILSFTVVIRVYALCLLNCTKGQSLLYKQPCTLLRNAHGLVYSCHVLECTPRENGEGIQ